MNISCFWSTKKNCIILVTVVFLILAIGIGFVWACPEYCIRQGMTYGQVNWLMGEEFNTVGSGVVRYEWELSRGRYLYVTFQLPRGEGATPPDDLIVKTVEITEQKAYQ